MAKTFDALTRALLESHPTDWLNLLGGGDSELVLTWRSWFGRNAVSVSFGRGLGG
jgi:hypothetical protein